MKSKTPLAHFIIIAWNINLLRFIILFLLIPLPLILFSQEKTKNDTVFPVSARPTKEVNLTITAHQAGEAAVKATDAYSTATYGSGNIATDGSFTSLPGSSSCPGTLVVTIPVDALITSVDVSYSMTARNWGWMSDQRSQLRCVSPGGTAEGQLYEGSGRTGTYDYSRTGLTIANNVTGGGNITFELHAGRTWGGSGCNTTYNRVNNNTWTVTVHYIMDAIPDFSASPVSAAPAIPITFTDLSLGNVNTWAWDFGAGASPATASTAGPHSVVYTSLGYKTVSLTVNGSITETKVDYIFIADPDNWLHWDDGINSSKVGLNSYGVFQTAARFEPADITLYNGYQITKLKVYVGDLPNAAIIKIWQGPNSQNLTEYVSQSFSPQADNWNTIELNSPYYVNINEELWFGMEWTDPGYYTYPVGIDNNTNYDGKGNMLRLDTGNPDAWVALSYYNISGDWNIQAYLVPAGIIWTGAVSIDWHTANNWSNFSVPHIGSNITIPPTANNPLISSEATANNITIEAGAVLTVAPTGNFTVEGTMTNLAGETGFNIQSDATGTGSLLCNTDLVPGSFQRYIKGDPEAWHLISSPVANQEIAGDFTPAGTYADGTGYDFFTWYEPDTSWVYLLNTTWSPTWSQTQAGNDFVPAKGYLVSYQAVNPTKTFAGNLNSGPVSISLTKTDGISDQFGANLVGNPYPSSIDWKAAAGWERSALIPDGGGYNIWIWNDTAYNYGVYNSGSANDDGTLGVSRYIPPAQGFFVQAAQSGNLGMTNEVRTNIGSDNWLKSKKNILFVSLDSDEGLGNDQVVIEFGHPENSGGTPKKFSFINWAPSLYIPRDNICYSMIMLSEPAKSPVIPLAVKSTREGSYRLTIHTDHGMTDLLMLTDQKTGASQDMLKEPVYHFSIPANDHESRFVLQLQPGVFPDPYRELPVEVYASNQTLYVDLRLVKDPCQIQMFDLTGRQAGSVEKSGGSKYAIPLLQQHGVYIVRITSNNTQYSKKIIF